MDDVSGQQGGNLKMTRTRFGGEEINLNSWLIEEGERENERCCMIIGQETDGKRDYWLYLCIEVIMQTHRFVIVGAGLSGLQAAAILAEQNQDFVILEAGPRIGGRVYTLTIGEAIEKFSIDAPYPWLTQQVKKLPVECGATWISQEQPQMHRLVQEFGLTMFPQNYIGKNVMALSSKEYLHVKNLGEYYFHHRNKILKLLAGMRHIQDRIKQLMSLRASNLIPPAGRLELDELLQKYDSMKAYDYILETVQDKFLADLLINEATTLECVRPDDYSVLTLMADRAHNLANVKFYVGVDSANIDGFRLEQGMTTIVMMLKQRIDHYQTKRGKRIKDWLKLNTPVTEIQNQFSPVEVITKEGIHYRCQKVIVAVPIATLGKIKFETISPGKKLLIDNQLDNVMARQAMIFKKPFWRPSHCGYVNFSHEFIMNELVDLTPHDGSVGILGFVFLGDGLKNWQAQIAKSCGDLTGEALRKKAYQVNKRMSMQILADIFFEGDTSREELQEVAIFIGSLSTNPYIRSTYEASTRIETFNKIHALGEDFNEARYRDQKNVVLLGSDFSEEFEGYMEGAIRIASKKVRRLLLPSSSL